MRVIGTFNYLIRSIGMRKTLLLLLAILIPLSAFAAKENFFIRASSDIVAYFNTYYNAKEYYKESQSLYEEEEDKSNIVPKTKTALDKAAKQCELVIRKFPNSSFIDDCMFMGAICQFEMQRYKKALEILEELTLKFPDSPYYFEAKLWISKVFFEMNKKTIAYNLLEQFLDNINNKEYFSDAYSLMGYLALQEDDKDKALNAFVQAAEQAYIKEDRCNMYLEAAEILMEKSKYDEALKMTQKASRSIKFDEQRARVQIAFTRIYRMKGEKLNALDIIAKSKLDARIAQYWGDIIYEEANIHFSDGNNDEAVRLLRNVVKDKTYRSNRDSQAWVKSAFKLGEYYLYDDSNLDSSKYFFNQAKTKKVQAQEGRKADDYIQIYKKLENINRALNNLTKNTPALGDSAWVQYEILSDSSQTEMSKRELLYSDTLTVDSSGVDSIKTLINNNYFRYTKALEKYVESANSYVDNLNTLAGIFLFELNYPDSAMTIYTKIEKEYYFTSDIPLALYSQSYIWEYEYANSKIADSLKQELTYRFPHSEISNYILGQIPRDSILYYENQDKLYDIETKYFDEGNYKDGIVALKKLLRDDDMDKKNHAFIAYKIAWLYDNELSRDENTQDSTLKYYHMVKKQHPGSVFASNSARRISAIETDITDYLAYLAGDSSKIQSTNIDSQLLTFGDGKDNSEKRKEHPIYRRLKSPGRPRPLRF